MFMYLDDSFSKSEKLIMTLFQVGAMAQADLRKVLGWDDYTTSKIITSLNGGGKNKRSIKIGEFVERPGVRNSGKIRFLTKHGIEMAVAMSGVEPMPILKESEARIAAQLTKFAVSYADFERTAYNGPYLAQSHYNLSVTNPNTRLKNLRKITIPTPPIFLESQNEETTSNTVWLTWISQATAESIIFQRLREWRVVIRKMSVLRKLPVEDAIYGLLVVCQNQKTADRVSEIAKMVKGLFFGVVAMDNLDPENLYTLSGFSE